MRIRIPVTTFVILFATLGGCSPEEEPKPDCPVNQGDPEWEPHESSCDGLDNDCDGLTDELLPWPSNRCSTNGKGVCNAGWSECIQGVRACRPDPPELETWDGKDNDCNGAVDDVIPVDLPVMRARILMPPSVHADEEVDATTLKQVLASLNAKRGAAKNAIEKAELDKQIKHTEKQIEGFAVLGQYRSLMGKLRDSKDPSVHAAIEPKLAELRDAAVAAHRPKSSGVVAHILQQAGIPHERWTPDSKHSALEDWVGGLNELDKYSLIILPGYLQPSFVDPASGHLDRLKTWVTAGGVLVWTKLVGPGANDNPDAIARKKQVLKFAGIETQTKAADTRSVHIAADSPATRWLDQAAERRIKLMDERAEWRHEVFLYTALPGAEIIATARDKDDKVLGATWIRRRIGKGAVYTLGWNVADYTVNRCYVNCFDPGTDVAAMFYKGAWAEAAKGHYIVKHTVPGTEPAVLIPSHDVDAPDSNNAGMWGNAGAVQMAEMENKRGVKGSYFITTDYVADYYNEDMVRRLKELGQLPSGGHTVQHLNWSKFNRGTCTETRKTYAPATKTICGEVNVSLELLRKVLGGGVRLDAWRTPYLQASPYQLEVLWRAGVRYDSSHATGNLRTNFPVDVTEYQYYAIEQVPKSRRMFVIPIGLEDGIGAKVGDKFTRVELNRARWARFRALWTENIIGNLGNGAWTTLLVHPSVGVGDGITSSNLKMKVEATEYAIKLAQDRGMHIDTMGRLGDFWRGRADARLSAISYSDKAGYSVSVQVGKDGAERFSLEFGDAIDKVTCSGCGTAKVQGRRVVFATMPAGKTVKVTASVKKSQ